MMAGAAFFEGVGGAQGGEFFGHGCYDQLVEAGAVLTRNLFQLALERGGEAQGVVAGNAHFDLFRVITAPPQTPRPRQADAALPASELRATHAIRGW